jgi:mono/diheme cytochrome c family protein
MLKRLLFVAAAASIALTMSYADQSNQSKDKVVISVGKTNPTDGKQMYGNYCAPCHGVDGRGYGPVSSSLKVQPTDLTGLAKANHGKYPETHIISVVKFGTDVRAHGSPEMPVWGPILGTISKINPQEKELRTTNLSRYLETLQVR